MTAAQLATTIEAELRGDPALVLTGCSGLDDAGPQHVSFLANKRYAKGVKSTRAGAIILGPADAALAPQGVTLLVARHPYFAFRQAVVALHGYRKLPAPGISPQAVIDPTASIGPGCSIGPFAIVEAGASIGARSVIYPNAFIGAGATLGEECVIHPGVAIYESCTLGQRVIVHANSVIGQDGFGFATHRRPNEELKHHKIPQIGIVVIEDDVEIGSGCAIERATVGATRIGRGTKMSDLVTIGHGATIGKHNLIVAQVGIAGSSTTGDFVVLGGQVGIAGHLSIGAGAQLAAQSGVIGDIPPGTQYGGLPAMPMSLARRVAAGMARLPDMLAEMRELKKRVAELEARDAAG